MPTLSNGGKESLTDDREIDEGDKLRECIWGFVIQTNLLYKQIYEDMEIYEK